VESNLFGLAGREGMMEVEGRKVMEVEGSRKVREGSRDW
jgi:hypothetical protein